MIVIDRNKITVNKDDLCVVDLKLCQYKLKPNDIIEINIDGEIFKQRYNELDINFPTDKKGVFNYTISILQEGVIRTTVIKNILEVI